MPRAAERSDRINLRLTPGAKRTIERAAAYSDKTLTDFVTEAAFARAEMIVEQHEAILLAPDAWETFRGLLLDPPESNPRLNAAIAEHARVVRR